VDNYEPYAADSYVDGTSDYTEKPFTSEQKISLHRGDRHGDIAPMGERPVKAKCKSILT